MKKLKETQQSDGDALYHCKKRMGDRTPSRFTQQRSGSALPIAKSNWIIKLLTANL